MKVTYLLSTIECTISNAASAEKSHHYHTSCVRMLTKYESNLHAEQKFTQLEVEVASGEKKKLFINHTP